MFGLETPVEFDCVGEIIAVWVLNGRQTVQAFSSMVVLAHTSHAYILGLFGLILGIM